MRIHNFRNVRITDSHIFADVDVVTFFFFKKNDIVCRRRNGGPWMRIGTGEALCTYALENLYSVWYAIQDLNNSNEEEK